VNGADWYNGLWNAPVGVMVVYTLVLTHITIVSVTVYLHRYSAHRALELHPALQHFFRFWLWLTTGMLTKQWTAIHRKHHATCETPDDPHSPQVHGLTTVLFKGAELYGIEAHKPGTLERFGRGTPDDWMERNVYQRYKRYGIALMAVIDVLLFGALGLTVWAVQMLWIPFLAAGVVNGLGHYAGYRNFETPDASTNLLPWGLLIGGEELHNNHHAYPSSAKLSVKWWEFDLGWFWIRLFSLLGLAKPLRIGPLVTSGAAVKHAIEETRIAR
jgi:stearoyl-CoA desaturase (delta-9 desaturase)